MKIRSVPTGCYFLQVDVVKQIGTYLQAVFVNTAITSDIVLFCNAQMDSVLSKTPGSFVIEYFTRSVLTNF
jgi:hypothetical protein